MNDQPEASDHLRQRASNADREQVAQILHDAMAEGRLSVEELEERLDTLYAAKTYGELEPLTRDLPATGIPTTKAMVPAACTAPANRFGSTPTSTSATAVMSGVRHNGPWVVPATYNAFAFWGGIELDLRDARFVEPETTIRATAIMGGVVVIVPPDLTVVVDGTAFMGGFDHEGAGEGPPGSPVLRVTGFALWGGVVVQRKEREPERKQIQR